MQTPSSNMTAVDPSASRSFRRLAIGMFLAAVIYLVCLGLYAYSKALSPRQVLAPYIVLPKIKIMSADVIRSTFGPRDEVVTGTFKMPKGMKRAEFRKLLSKQNGFGPWTTATKLGMVEDQDGFATWNTSKGSRTYQFDFMNRDEPVQLTISNAGISTAITGPPVRILGPGGTPAVRGSIRSSGTRIGGTHSSIGSPAPIHPKNPHTGP